MTFGDKSDNIAIGIFIVYLELFNYFQLKGGCHLFETKRFSLEQPHLNAAPVVHFPIFVSGNA